VSHRATTILIIVLTIELIAQIVFITAAFTGHIRLSNC
jgi:hypothetical protein